MVITVGIEWKALDSKVIVVAREGAVGDWAAYIGAVKGNKHEVEWLDVRDNGTKLPRHIAEVIFPNFKHLRWRD